MKQEYRNKAWSLKLTKDGNTKETFVYSDTGTDIESRFPAYKVTDIKEIPDPLGQEYKQTKTKEKYA